MGKKQKNYYLDEEFLKTLRQQALKRGIRYEAEVIQRDLQELWSLKENAEKDIHDKLDSIKTIVTRIDKNTKQI